MGVLKLGDYLRLGEAELRKGAHPSSARNDAELLLCNLLRKNRAWLLTNRQADLHRQQLEAYSQLLSRRQSGEPIQYILGETEFYRLAIRVTPDVLIPRPETEHLVEKAIQLVPVFHPKSGKLFEVRKTKTGKARSLRRENSDGLGEAGWPPRVLDVGTGSGAIAISIAHDWPDAEITAIDSSRAALNVAVGNATRLGYVDDIRFLQGDLLAPVAGEQFEMIVSNPPYVAETDRESLAVEVREYEPAIALFAGADGLAIYRCLIPEAHAALVSGGYLLLEIGYGQSGAVGELLDASGFDVIEFVPDLQGIPRVAVARRQ